MRLSGAFGRRGTLVLRRRLILRGGLVLSLMAFLKAFSGLSFGRGAGGGVFGFSLFGALGLASRLSFCGPVVPRSGFLAVLSAIRRLRLRLRLSFRRASVMRLS